MSETRIPGMQKKYHVRIGLAQCTVAGDSEQEAVREARAHLNREMPQMAAVIRGIKDKEFRVDPVG